MSDKRGILQFMGVANLILAALFIFFSLPFFWKQYHVLRAWPETDAQVLRSDVVSRRAAAHEQLYAAKLEIVYTVDGQPITVDLTSYESSNYQATQSRAAELAIGSHHLIRYDPQNPTQARIGAGWNARFFAVPLLMLAIGALFGLVAAVLLVIGGLA
jgi:hypothetical protein